NGTGISPPTLSHFPAFEESDSVVEQGFAASRSALPLPPLRGERVGVRGADGRVRVADATESKARRRLAKPLGTTAGHRLAARPPHPNLLPPKRGGEGAHLRKWKFPRSITADLSLRSNVWMLPACSRCLQEP